MTFNRPQPEPTPDSETAAILEDPDALAAIEEAEADLAALVATERLMNFSSTNDEYTWFKEREGNKILSLAAIERETYDEFGQPDTITVTIRPGDLSADD